MEMPLDSSGFCFAHCSVEDLITTYCCLNQKQSDIYTKHHQTQYPTLAKITWDHLAIQGSSVLSECTFSGGGLTDTKTRSQLSLVTFKALKILKSCY